MKKVDVHIGEMDWWESIIEVGEEMDLTRFNLLDSIF